MVAVRWRDRPPVRAQLLARMAQEYGWRHGAELGVLRGDTLLYLLRTCPQLYMVAVDLWAPQPEQDARRAEGGRSYAGHDLEGYYNALRAAVERYGFRAQLCRMTTVEAATLVVDGSLDFVFIDADHTEEGVSADIAMWRPKVKPGGWLMGHDYNERGFPGVVRAVDRLVGEPLLFKDHVWATRI